jgi:hypothetical protein
MSWTAIDRTKLRRALRSAGEDTIFYLLDRAIELLPDPQLLELVRPYLPLEPLAPDTHDTGGLLADVEAFARASLAGEYYEDFLVNSRNCMDTSSGTRAWITECRRLLDRSIAADDLPRAVVREAIERIFDLLRRIDACREDIIFFADEAGSWQVGVDWARFPCWFACLAETTAPDEYAREVVSAVHEFESYLRDQHLADAHRLATPQQALALRAAIDAAERSRGPR